MVLSTIFFIEKQQWMHILSYTYTLMIMNIGKEALRNSLRDRRWTIPDTDRQTMSGAICNHLREIITPDEEVLIYCAKEPEVDTLPLIRYLIDEGIPVIVPIIQEKDTSLRLSYLEDPTCLISSTFRVPEPIGSEIPANAEDVTTGIIPLLGYDRSGGRIGYGAGYYDRFLSEHDHIRKIGIAYQCQEVTHVPTDPNDIFMDLIINEDGICFSRS